MLLLCLELVLWGQSTGKGKGEVPGGSGKVVLAGNLLNVTRNYMNFQLQYNSIAYKALYLFGNRLVLAYISLYLLGNRWC